MQISKKELAKLRLAMNEISQIIKTDIPNSDLSELHILVKDANDVAEDVVSVASDMECKIEDLKDKIEEMLQSQQEEE